MYKPCLLLPSWSSLKRCPHPDHDDYIQYFWYSVHGYRRHCRLCRAHREKGAPLFPEKYFPQKLSSVGAISDEQLAEELRHAPSSHFWRVPPGTNPRPQVETPAEQPAEEFRQCELSNLRVLDSSPSAYQAWWTAKQANPATRCWRSYLNSLPAPPQDITTVKPAHSYAYDDVLSSKIDYLAVIFDVE